MEEPTRIFIVPPDIASDVEAALVMMGIEQRVPVDKIEVKASSFVPRDTIYVLPKGIPDPPIIDKGPWLWDPDFPGYLSWYASRALWPFVPDSGLSSIASVVSDGPDTSPTSPSPRWPTFISAWRRLMGRLRDLLR